MKSLFLCCAIIVVFAASSFAQPRPVEKAAPPAAETIKPAPETFEAKYMGGMFGFSQKMEGTLKFDEVNSRFIFLDKEKKELFSIPYETIMVVSPATRSTTSTTGNVVRNIPLPGAALGGLIKEKKNYLVLSFSDPDADVRGTISFKIDNKDLLTSIVKSLGEKATLVARGDSYYRPRKKPTVVEIKKVQVIEEIN